MSQYVAVSGSGRRPAHPSLPTLPVTPVVRRPAERTPRELPSAPTIHTPLTGPSSTLTPLPTNSPAIRSSSSHMSCRSHAMTLVNCDGYWVTKSVCRSPAAIISSRRIVPLTAVIVAEARDAEARHAPRVCLARPVDARREVEFLLEGHPGHEARGALGCGGPSLAVIRLDGLPEGGEEGEELRRRVDGDPHDG